MVLTDIDGTPLVVDVEMIVEMHDRKAYREVRTSMKDILQVRESIPEIMRRIREDKLK